MDKISVSKLTEEHFSNLSSIFKEHLNINNLQSYFPILSIYFNYYNNEYSHKNFTLKSKYVLKNITDKIEYENKDSYIKMMFNGEILNNYNNEITNKRIFVKLSPILDVLPYLMNHYNTSHTQTLPNIFSYISNKKINSYNNSAYIDSFSSFALSRLTEKGLCPTFPFFYGTFSGVSEEFDFDISEEYDSIKNCKWFKQNMRDKFSIRKEQHKAFTLDSESLNSSDCGSLDCEELDINLDSDNESNNEKLESSILGEDKIKLEEQVEDNENEENIKDCESKDDIENEDLNINDEDLTINDEDLNINDEDIKFSDEDKDEDEDEDKDKDEDENEDDEWEDINSDSDDESSGSLSSAHTLNSEDLLDLESYKNIYYTRLKDFPVQLGVMELCDKTLDELIEDEEYEIKELEWKSILFQVCFGMAVAQKHYDFVHNDLHSSNIMLVNTKKKHIFVKYKQNYFKIPTFGKIAKIIDFGRATFRIDDKLFFSDVFKKYGDAEGQYSYPYNNSLKKCKILPNKSFDLARLSTTIVEYFENDSELYNLMKSWATDRYGNSLIYEEDDFDLYRNIAKNVLNSVPKDQLNKKVFRCFKIKREKIPKNEFIYVY